MRTNSRNPRLDIQIDRLVLRGVDPLDKVALVNALRAELTRSLADSDPATGIANVRSRRVPGLRATVPTLEPGLAGARALGAGVARAIVKGIKP
jgi:hypothetical protein